MSERKPYVPPVLVKRTMLGAVVAAASSNNWVG